jgi:uncharacterized membrane protein YsdA (DUF1294 family)
MSLIKLAVQPVIVINKTDPNNQGSKTFNAKNLVAAVTGGTTGFLASHKIEHLPKFNDKLLSHQYAKRMGSVLGGFTGAAAAYKLMNKKKEQDQSPKFYML